MNRARVHALLDELLDAITDDDAPPAKVKPRPKPKARRLPPEPSAPVTEEDRARARAAMAAQGFTRRAS